MVKKKFGPGQVVAKLRQIEVLMGCGKSIGRACKEAGITDVRYDRWRREYGGLQTGRTKKLKELGRDHKTSRQPALFT